MTLSLQESRAISELAGIVYNFLPGNPNPFADRRISFAAIAVELGLEWPGGSKRPAIVRLLERTLAEKKDFSRLMVEVVRRAISYRENKGQPLSREEIDSLNSLIQKVGYKIPDLLERSFLASLPPKMGSAQDSATTASRQTLSQLTDRLMSFGGMPAQKRGFEFEKFLRDLFEAFGLKPRNSFRLVGEQIDGSLQLDSDTYLVEAKWQNKPIGNTELLAFAAKVGGKSSWSRGIFISYSGFSQDGLKAFGRGRPTNIIGMNGEDICLILDGKLPLPEAIRRKAREAAETGQVMVRVYSLV